MNRKEFELLRDLSDKVIESDIIWSQKKGMAKNLVFDKIQVLNSLGFDVLLNGTYKPALKAISFNFVVSGIGPICRLEINGLSHGKAGRNHKHDLNDESDPCNNLPYAINKDDLANKNPTELWRILCSFANIKHNGNFIDPEGGKS